MVVVVVVVVVALGGVREREEGAERGIGVVAMTVSIVTTGQPGTLQSSKGRRCAVSWLF